MEDGPQRERTRGEFMETLRIWVQVGGWRCVPHHVAVRRERRIEALLRGSFRAAAPRGVAAVVSGPELLDGEALPPEGVLAAACARIHEPRATESVVASLFDLPRRVPCLVTLRLDGDSRALEATFDPSGVTAYTELQLVGRESGPLIDFDTRTGSESAA